MAILSLEKNRALDLLIMTELRQADLPVTVRTEISTIMYGMNFIVSVPGQSRTVFITGKKLIEASTNASMALEITDEIKFAAWVLLDKDEDDA